MTKTWKALESANKKFQITEREFSHRNLTPKALKQKLFHFDQKYRCNNAQDKLCTFDSDQ